MIIYLAGDGWERVCWMDREFYDFNRLNSFIYLKDYEKSVIHKYKNFLFDSGAFTYMNNYKGGAVDWDDYVTRYGKLVKDQNIEYYLEMDIDVLVGLAEVERLRQLLETVAGRKCIPVWHRARGLAKWVEMCENYDYVAIGGLVTREIKKSEYGIFDHLLKIANANNCKVHALGFTNLKALTRYKFYSVDSTAWLSGNRFGFVYSFDGKTLQQHKRPGHRTVNKVTTIHNFDQWVKFSNYALKNL